MIEVLVSVHLVQLVAEDGVTGQHVLMRASRWGGIERARPFPESVRVSAEQLSSGFLLFPEGVVGVGGERCGGVKAGQPEDSTAGTSTRIRSPRLRSRFAAIGTGDSGNSARHPGNGRGGEQDQLSTPRVRRFVLEATE
ncbi:hypothetical protein [Nocardia speluncae]|uniref:hypothetical protein n=1 Tax=Nocardia speluncae TaxID=419477 RepID=UPI00082C9D6A|nr:hypothetical protein [Nocardia speluncae]